MPRDLPTRRVFLSGLHFVSFIPLVLLRVVSDREVEEVETLYHAVFFRWDLPRCSRPTPFAAVWDIQRVPSLALLVVRVEMLAFIRNKK